jgi:hypothetical protein
LSFYEEVEVGAFVYRLHSRALTVAMPLKAGPNGALSGVTFTNVSHIQCIVPKIGPSSQPFWSDLALG